MPPQGPYGAPPSYTPAPQSFPPQAPSPEDSSRYDFLMGSGKPMKRSPLSGLSGGSFGGRIAIIVGGAVALMIIVGIILSFIPSSLNTQDLTTLGQTQNELLSICTDATENAKQQTNLNFAENCMLTLMTDQQTLQAYTAAHGLKLSSKTLAAGNNTQIAATLKASLASSTYDTAFTSAAQSQLSLYTTRLKSTFNSAKSASQKQLLNSAYTNAQLLTTQLNGSASS